MRDVNLKIVYPTFRLQKKTTDSYTLPISSHCEHIWECIGMSTSGLKYRCSVCGIVKSEPVTNTTEIVARL